MDKITIDSVGESEFEAIHKNCEKLMKGALEDWIASDAVRCISARGFPIEANCKTTERAMSLFLDGYNSGMAAALYLIQTGQLKTVMVTKDADDNAKS